ncbi:ankyrin repeat domain-containing protein [Polaribacter batillariae]|uniref:Ankyrin repeat domain-containing protein n=1 Tax=Polaribacter batillariae TaxID=2808900 RepID=A0ABX7STQ0_9FLAO|nr:ankyrin repeat domain-containing protein [Polaribacter batillariae]QTD36693.1 ankyrin repeat domain-containing protein [Polaribacter batillariae]
MKKLILPMLLCLCTFTVTTNATSISSTKIEQSLKITTNYKISAFCKLIQMGNYDAVEALIKSGEDVNKKSNGLTPLMFAARHNKAKIAKLLIKNGANIKAKSTKGKMTALDIAKRSKAKDAIKVIEEALS